MRKLILAGLVFFAIQVSINSENRVQSIRAERIESLNSGPASVWWASAGAVDPVETSQELLSDSSRLDSPGDRWISVKVPGNLCQEKEFCVTSKDAWYLKSFLLEELPDGHLSFRLGEIMDRDEVYLNGQLIGKTGTWDSPRPQGYDRHRIYDIPDRALRRGKNVLLVHVRGFFPSELGIYRDRTEIGPSSEINGEFLVKNLIECLFLMTYLTSGGYFLFLFIRRRSERENIYFALFALSMVIYQFLRTQFKYLFGLDFYLMKKIEYAVLFQTITYFYFFVRYLFRLPDTNFTKWFDRFMVLPHLGAAFAILFVLFTDSVTAWSRVNYFVIQYTVWPTYIVATALILARRIAKKDRDALYMSAGIAFLLIAAVTDILSNRGLFNIPRIMSFAFMMFVSSLALILANRFVRLNEEVEDLNRNLEKKVQDRTEQLQRSLEEVRALKVQQDGDYFLTSLLISPLGGNFTDSKTIATDILTRQKKKFQFKKWNAEIGGDLCLAQSIRLKGRVYTVFLNGDAMGKSIQGAGGALVLGTVFKSILTRTELSPQASDVYPEIWLKDCFVELQNVFVSFDGFMMVSAVIGLIDDETGTLYFVNVEHPWLVLYRDGRASFIENDMMLRKFGVSFMQSRFQVRIFPMKPNDVIISGSDGRDDILLGVDDHGNRIINEDEYSFLRAVEAGDGLLGEIEKLLRSEGEITDDLSLVRIAYKEDFPAEALPSQDVEKLREDAARSFESKDFQKAADLYLRCSEVSPEDTELLYAVSRSLKSASGGKKSVLLRAAEFGERCSLRSPDMIKNLVNLADIQRLLGNSDRVRELASRALELNPSEEKARKILESLPGGR